MKKMIYGVSMEEAGAALSGNLLLMDIAAAKQAYLRGNLDLLDYECAIEIALEKDQRRNAEATEAAQRRMGLLP